MTERREPQFCPSCAAPLPEGPRGREPFSTTVDGDGWDCYCAACKWSGDIFPDDEGEK